jgi:hypothetical protein
MLKPLIFSSLLLLTISKYFTCDADGHACKEGTTCCKRKNNDYGCCPLEHAVCCADSDGHCCPLGFPICDVAHKKCMNHLQSFQTISLKTESLNVKNSTLFFLGLASGLGVRLDQYASCTNEISIVFALFQQVFKYFQGDTRLDRIILVEKIGEALIHFSDASFTCEGAFRTSVNFVQEFLEGIENKFDVFWTVAANFASSGNYVMREVNGFFDADWQDRGERVGRIASYLLRLR